MTDATPGRQLPVSALRSDTVARISGQATLLEVADALLRNDVGALVVGVGDAVEGVVSERDVARALAARRDPATTRAIDVASTNVIWCDANSAIADVAKEMMDCYLRHVLVEEDGRLVGVVSARDLLGFYAATDADIGDEVAF